MPNNPIQVILERDRFHLAKETKRTPRSGKDFYAHQDDAFRDHKHDLIRRVERAQGVLQRQSIGYAKITMRGDALAKSHRPYEIFEPEIMPVVGADDLGEVLIEVTGRFIHHALGHDRRRRLRWASEPPLASRMTQESSGVFLARQRPNIGQRRHMDPGTAHVLDKIITAMERVEFAKPYVAEARAALKAEMAEMAEKAEPIVEASEIATAPVPPAATAIDGAVTLGRETPDAHDDERPEA